MIFTRVEGLLRDRIRTAPVPPSDPLRSLARRGIPLVLVSAWPASEMCRLQQEFALDQPFICEDGAALHVPRTWLGEPASAVEDPRRGEVFHFVPASISAAFRLVSAMFVARGHDPLLTVGVGCDIGDYPLLTAVDIPIVVRDRSERQLDLLRQLPGVYVTSASGTAGWSEAMFGPAH